MLAVPIDPGSADGASLSLRIALLPSIDPGHKRGTLLFIPGGPGVSIEGTLGGAERQIAEFRRHFDVVTFDPRGVGESDPIRCDPSAVPKPPAP